MDVILPVAGLGKRLRPHTWSRPKPLISVAGKPMMEHVIDRVLPAKPEKLVFITGYLGEQIESWARETYADHEVELAFVEQEEMLGQSDAILRVRDHCRQDALILFPDALFDAEFVDLGSLEADGLIYTKEVDDPSDYGIALLEGDRIVKLIEKPSEPVSREAVIGIYYFRNMPDLYAAIEQQIAENIQTKGEFFIADAIQLMLEDNKFETRRVDFWEDCGNVDALLATNRILLDLYPPATGGHPQAVIVPPSFVDQTATVENAVVGPYASIGANAVVRNAVVKNTIVEESAEIDSAVLEHSVIGPDSNVTGQPSRLSVGETTKVDL